LENASGIDFNLILMQQQKEQNPRVNQDQKNEVSLNGIENDEKGEESMDLEEDEEQFILLSPDPRKSDDESTEILETISLSSDSPTVHKADSNLSFVSSISSNSLAGSCGQSLGDLSDISSDPDELLDAPEESYNCPDCNKFLPTQKDLAFHVKHFHTIGQNLEATFTCKICQKSYHKLTHLKKHKRKRHPKCQLCSKRYQNLLSFQHHQTVKHPTLNKYRCVFCDLAVFSTSKELKNHQKRCKFNWN
jgi:hypothetical protein